MVSFLLLSGAIHKPKKKRPPLEKTIWTLVRIGEDQQIIQPVGEKKLTITFDQLKVTGFAGCNSFFGEYVRTKQQLSLIDLNRTESHCDRYALEEQFLKSIQRCKRFQITSNTLKLYDGDKILAVFSSTPK